MIIILVYHQKKIIISKHQILMIEEKHYNPNYNLKLMLNQFIKIKIVSILKDHKFIIN